MIASLIRALIKKPTEKQLIEEWLADSASLSDLERRQRLIERNQAPWQVQANNNLRGWV